MYAQKNIVFTVMAVMLLSGFANAAIIPVSGGAGWGFGLNGWPNGQTFKTGDVLSFKYSPQAHNVVVVSKENYDSCTAVGQKFTSGNDQIPLTAAGTTYYICGVPGHCAGGIKAAVTVV